MLRSLRRVVKEASDNEKAAILSRFFKTGKGEYGEGDIFVGLTVPVSRKIAVQFADLPFSDIKKLLVSRIHEERLNALLILVHNFSRRDSKIKKKIYKYYLLNTKYINNWDLVDLSADKIVGEYLLDNPKEENILEKLARSNNIWKRRIAIVSTYQYIKTGNYKKTFKIAELLMNDKHDLIHKAVGWMLREVGKRISQEVEVKFLNKHYKTMPRAMLRYAIERFPEKLRLSYLNGSV